MFQQRKQIIQKDFKFSRNWQNFNKENYSPPSTIQSNSPRDYIDECKNTYIDTTKQKSQLCKKFIQNGFCPYKKKCKFAHGSHELRKNSYVNSKYKTKQCGVFLNQGCCMYGDRCNFIHKTSSKSQKQEQVDYIFLQIKNHKRYQSRLFRILQ